MAKKKTAKKSNDSWLRRHTLSVMIASGVALAVVAVFLAFALVGYRGERQWLYLPHDIDSAALHDTLRTRLGSSLANRVMTLYRLQGGGPSTPRGAYRIDHGQSALSISRNLAFGRQTPLTVTISYPRTVDDVARKVAAKLTCTRREFLDACQSELTRQGYSRQEWPAAFLPDTYEFYWSSTPDKVVERLVDYRDKFWNSRRRGKAKDLGLTPVQVATIASIVEEESAKTDEWPMIARLYMNRLEQGIKLQADPTVKFAVGDHSIRRITGRHLKTPSPYNTYRVQGLPPGPIRVASAKSIDAVLDAPDHNYLYMCARSDFSGYHDFSEDYPSHQAKARRYQQALDLRGIK